MSVCSSPNEMPDLSLTPDRLSSAETSFSGSDYEELVDQEVVKCINCSAEFKCKAYLKRHVCMFRPDLKLLSLPHVKPTVLKLPKAWQDTLRIVHNLCSEDIVSLCRLQMWCLPNYYPFCFPNCIRVGHIGIPPVLEEKTANRSSTDLLKRMVDMFGEFKLPRYILIQDENGNNITFLSSNVLRPTTDFNFLEDEEHFIVKKDTVGFPLSYHQPENILPLQPDILGGDGSHPQSSRCDIAPDHTYTAFQ